MKPVSNLAASVRQRLQNCAKQQDTDLQLLFTRYANERLLYRLSQSEYKHRFILKGATLFSAWIPTPHRATRDVDLLGQGTVTERTLTETFTALAGMTFDDGLTYDSRSISVTPIREDNPYGGLRVRLQCRLGSARIPMQVDVGIGDVHSSVEVELPSILAQPSPRLIAYERETVIAEKLEATVTLGVTNSRMKDFYDLATLGDLFEFSGRKVRTAIASTFERRNTTLPTRALRELLEDLEDESSTEVQWKAFVKKAAPRSDWSLTETFALVIAFAEAPLLAAATSTDFHQSWPPGGPWQEGEPGRGHASGGGRDQAAGGRRGAPA